MAYLGITLLCLAIVSGSMSDDNIHRFMSPEEVARVFHADHDSVPEYEIVKINLPERLHKRDVPGGSQMHIGAFGENINLWLHPSDSILAGEDTPVYYARYSPYEPEQVEYMRRNGLMRNIGRMFEDPYQLASFVIGTEDSGRPRVNGHIESRKMVVRSLPSRVAEEYRRRRRSIGDLDDSDSPYHVVFKTSEKYEDAVLPVNQTALRQRASRSVSVIPNTLYPEILVVVEHTIYSAYQRDIYGLLEYLLAFWNGVDLKYRSLESPSVRFHISAIILSLDPLATPHIYKYSLGNGVFDALRAMNYAKYFFYGVKDKFPLDSYDFGVTMTRQVFGEKDKASVWGMAWTGKACEHSVYYETTSAVAILRDDSAFAGIHVAAHEIGHLMGAQHDNTTEHCHYNDGYLMSWGILFTKKTSDFSNCSAADIDTVLKNGKLDCLFNRPQALGKNIPRMMPGKMKTLEEQCAARGIGAPCQPKWKEMDICVNYYCLRDDGECIESTYAALDGTVCGDNKFCLHMQCVSL